jgi:hypothetical protein
MPPEQDDDRERQLAALRRYVTDLDVRRRQAIGQAGPAGTEPRRRTGWPWLLATLLLMAVSLAGGIAIGASRGPDSGRASGVAAATTTSAASPTAAPECAEAVARANQSLGHAVKVAGALREHTEIMNRLLNGELSLEAARKAGNPALIAGSAESAKFEVALADYRQLVDRCRLRTP